MTLRVATCSHEAARYAVMRWHYSRRMPVGKLVKYGAWEDEQFIGVVLFARGASPTLGARYGLDQTQTCELVRVALAEHRAPTSRIVTEALGLLRRSNPGLRLVVSFADPHYGHTGYIYQAMNWIYAGESTPETHYIDPRGRYWHRREITDSGMTTSFGRTRPTGGGRRSAAKQVQLPGKHRYLYPLDRAMRRKITPLAQPYPRGGSVESDTSGLRPEEAGATPAHRSEAV